jgi:hypothetical protein
MQVRPSQEPVKSPSEPEQERGVMGGLGTYLWWKIQTFFSSKTLVDIINKDLHDTISKEREYTKPTAKAITRLDPKIIEKLDLNPIQYDKPVFQHNITGLVHLAKVYSKNLKNEKALHEALLKHKPRIVPL